MHGARDQFACNSWLQPDGRRPLSKLDHHHLPPTAHVFRRLHPARALHRVLRRANRIDLIVARANDLRPPFVVDCLLLFKIVPQRSPRPAVRQPSSSSPPFPSARSRSRRASRERQLSPAPPGRATPNSLRGLVDVPFHSSPVPFLSGRSIHTRSDEL